MYRMSLHKDHLAEELWSFLYLNDDDDDDDDGDDDGDDDNDYLMDNLSTFD